MNAPVINTQEAVAFLRRMTPLPWHLVAFDPTNGGGPCDSACCETEEQAHAFIEKHNGHKNLYWHVNPLLRIPARGKAEIADVAAMAILHCDIDPRTEESPEECKARALKAIAAFPLRPTAIISSGSGVQAFWRLREPISINGDKAVAEVCKNRTARVANALGGDSVSNVDRVMRIPFTMNIPDAKKRAKGRVEAVAYEIESGGQEYNAEQFPTLESNQFECEAIVEVDTTRVEYIHDLGSLGVPDRIKVIIAQGQHPDEDQKPSRSEWLFDAVCGMVRAGVSDQTVFSIITDPMWAISGSVLDKGSNAERYAIRQIQNAKEAVARESDRFITTEKGFILRESQHNIRIALRKLGVALSYDTFQDRLLIEGLKNAGPLLDDRAMERLWLLVDQTFGFRPSKEFFWVVVSDAARQNSFHPVRDYLAGLVWDGVERLDTWLATYGGAADTPYVRAVGALTLIAAVRRVRQPGCKFDEMSVLESEQGTNKSSALRLLAVRDDWFTDDLPLNADSKRVIETLAGRWIVEAGELKGMRKGDVEHLKAFLSRQIDRSRMSYDRLVSEVPRQSIIVGTTNSDRYLRDGTGNRRFWPVKVTRFDLPALRRDRDQLWAEAAHREALSETIRLDAALYAAAAEVQEERRIEDPFVHALAAVLGDIRGKLSAHDTWEIVGVPAGMRAQEHNVRLGEAMKELGWERTKARIGGRYVHVYVRGDANERQHQVSVHKGSDGKVWADTVATRMKEPF